MDQNEKAFQKQVATMASQVAVMAVNPLMAGPGRCVPRLKASSHQEV